MREYRHANKVYCEQECSNVVLFRKYTESKTALKNGRIITVLNGQESIRTRDSRILKIEIIQYKGRSILVVCAKSEDGVAFTFIPGFLVKRNWRKQGSIKISLVDPIENYQQREEIKKFLGLSSKEIVYFWTY